MKGLQYLAGIMVDFVSKYCSLSVTLHHTDAITVVLFNAAGYSWLTTMAGYVPIKQSSYI